MNPCTCEAERGRAERLLNAWNDAISEYRAACDRLRQFKAWLRAVNNQWVRLLCDRIGSIEDYPIRYVDLPAELCRELAMFRSLLEATIPVAEWRVEVTKEQRDRMKQYYDAAKERYLACKDSLKPCKGCENEFKPKPECIKMCKGCEEDYCNTCFDAGIEAWELKKKEEENV